jgi:hypothetical protein
VHCPKCAGQVVVPFPEGSHLGESERPQPAAANPQTGQAQGGALFEHNDFDKILEEGHAAGRPAPHSPTVSDPDLDNPFAALPEYGAIPMGNAKRRPRGLFLTSGALAALSAIVVVLMGMAFFLGLLLGRSSP